MNCNYVSIIAVTALAISLVVLLFLVQRKPHFLHKPSYIPLQHLVQFRLINNDGALYLECLDLNLEATYKYPVLRDSNNIPFVYSYITGEKYIPHLVAEVGEVGIDQIYQDEHGNFVIYDTESSTFWSQVQADEAGQVYFTEIKETSVNKVIQTLNMSLQQDTHHNEFLVTSKNNEAITVHPVYVNSYTGLPVTIDQLTGAAYYIAALEENDGFRLHSVQIDKNNRGGYILTDIESDKQLTVICHSGEKIENPTFSPISAFKHSIHHEILNNSNYDYKVLYCEDKQLAASYGYKVIQLHNVQAVYSCLTGYYTIKYNQSHATIDVEALQPQQNAELLQIKTGFGLRGHVEISLTADSNDNSILVCLDHNTNTTEIYPTFRNTYTSDLLVYDRITGQAYIIKN